LCQIVIDAPVTLTVGIRQDAAENLATNTQMIELLRARAQTGYDITEAFSIGQLAKRHANELAPTGKGFYLVVTLVTSHTAVKLLRVDQVGELGKNELSGIHPGSLAEKLLSENRVKNSSRSHPNTRVRGP